ncbi:MAG: phage protein Gp36 family protein [Pseudomonadota bacterium]
MVYATPGQVIQSFGIGEVTQYLADEEGLLTDRLLLDAIAGTWTDSPSQEEMDAALAALARFERKIATTSNLMDSYLRSAVTLPLSEDDANIGTLNECCMALVRCALADDPENSTEKMEDCCKTWRKWLLDVARGAVLLVTPEGETLPGKSRVKFGQAKSGFDWTAHGVAR